VLSGSGFAPTQKPKWDKWQRSRRCPLWTAVALACDVDPTPYEPHGLPAFVTEDFFIFRVPGSVRELLVLANSAVGSGNLKVMPKEGASVMQREVDLGAFTSWLNGLGHKLPVEFPWTAKELDTSNIQWPWGDHQTKSLVLLAKAADKFWKNYDPTDHSTAPTNENVVKWLIENGVTERKAEIMASLLRPEEIAPGPRKK
jgi:hypothetical protein